MHTNEANIAPAQNHCIDEYHVATVQSDSFRFRFSVPRTGEQMADYSLITVPPGAERERFLPLLLLADESLEQVRSYMHSGDLYAFVGPEEAAVGIVLTIAAEQDAVELKAVAVDTTQQNRGIGRQMLAAVLQELRRRGVRRAIVGTANAGIGQLAYYQKAGFRLLRIERDFFSPARGYPAVMEDNGIRLRDMVWMDLELQTLCSAAE